MLVCFNVSLRGPLQGMTKASRPDDYFPAEGIEQIEKEAEEVHDWGTFGPELVKSDTETLTRNKVHDLSVQL